MTYAINGTWEEGQSYGGNNVTLPSGYYESVEALDGLLGCPISGVWRLEICDLWGQDNGFLFDAGLSIQGNLSSPTVTGCTNASACNYNPEAISDDASCEYPLEGFTCDGACVDVNINGFCDFDEMSGCTDDMACNYDSGATLDDGTCAYLEPFYDCEGNCLLDSDGDGVCDELEAPGCTLEFACNYDPTADQDDGSCVIVCPGCTDELACNFDPSALQDDGSCITVDECGICGGPGAIYECGCADIPEGDCDCDGNQLDAFDVCGGNCPADADMDGICDDVDDCFGTIDECGICNGPGAIYECGCSEVEEGFCDCGGTLSVPADTLSFFSQLGSGQTDSSSVVTAGSLSKMTFNLDFFGLSGSIPADMMVYVYAPNGECIVWGGYNIEPLEGCSNAGTGSGNSWPNSWSSSVPGFYTYALDISAYGLSGPGVWSVVLQNAYTGNTTLSFDLDIIFEGLQGEEGPQGEQCNCDGDVWDECGVCGGDGIPAGTCDCAGNVLDECGVCAGEGIPEGGVTVRGRRWICVGYAGETTRALAAPMNLRATTTLRRPSWMSPCATSARVLGARTWRHATTTRLFRRTMVRANTSATGAQILRRATMIQPLQRMTGPASTLTSVAYVGERESFQATAIVRATSLTNAASVAAMALPREHAIARATLWTIVGFAVAATSFPTASATAMAIFSTP